MDERARNAALPPCPQGSIWQYGDIAILRYYGVADFEWDPGKDVENRAKHAVAFADAQRAFLDPQRVIAVDLTHSTELETRFYCMGRVGAGVLTVRFTYRDRVVRIIGAGYWRRGRKVYEQANQVRR
jgi:uncharacterized DUF497 family protein